MDPITDPNGITKKIEDFLHWWIVDLGMPSFIRTKDGMRNARIKYRLEMVDIRMELSGEDDGDDAWIVRHTIVEPIEIKTCLLPKPTSKRKTPGFSFHADEVQLLLRLTTSGFIFGVFKENEFGVEVLCEVWYVPAGSELHKKHFESRLSDRSREGKEMTVTLTDVRRYARRLI